MKYPTEHSVHPLARSIHGSTVRLFVIFMHTPHLLSRFVGIISRAFTEQLLFSKPIGTYLIRVSEKMLGYVLSYHASDHCRHLLIEVIPQGHSYRFLGGAKKELFENLSQLIDKYTVSLAKHEHDRTALCLFVCHLRSIRPFAPIPLMFCVLHVVRSIPNVPTTPIYSLKMISYTNLCTYRLIQRPPRYSRQHICSQILFFIR